MSWQLQTIKNYPGFRKKSLKNQSICYLFLPLVRHQRSECKRLGKSRLVRPSAIHGRSGLLTRAKIEIICLI